MHWALRCRRRLRTVIGSYPVGFRTVRFPSVGSPTAVWNGLFELAVRDGADYFLAVRTQSVHMRAVLRLRSVMAPSAQGGPESSLSA